MTFWVAKMHDSWGFAAWNIESTQSFSKSKFLFTRLVLKYLKKGSARFLILSQWDILECKSFTLWEIASWLIGAYLKIQTLKCWEFSLLLQQWYLNSAVATKNCELLTQKLLRPHLLRTKEARTAEKGQLKWVVVFVYKLTFDISKWKKLCA